MGEGNHKGCPYGGRMGWWSSNPFVSRGGWFGNRPYLGWLAVVDDREGDGSRPPVFTGAGSLREDNGRGLGYPAGGGAVAFFDFDADGEVVFKLVEVSDDYDALEVLLEGG